MLELRKFRNKYNLELLLNSDEKMKIGDLFRDPILTKPIEDDTIPADIWRLLQKDNLITNNQKDKFRQQCKNIKFENANLSNVEKKIEFDFDLGLSVLKKLNLGNVQLAYNDVESFSFSNIRKKEITNDLAEIISDYINEFRDNNWNDYKKEIRRAFLVTELYYGDVIVKIKTAQKLAFDLAITNAGLDIQPKIETNKVVAYTFSSQNIPFAMKLAKIKKFNA